MSMSHKELYWYNKYQSASTPPMPQSAAKALMVFGLLMAWGILQLIIQAIFGRTVAEIYGVITTAIWAYLAIRWIVRIVNRISNAIYKGKAG